MKHQKVSVDVWAMLQTMFGYLMLAVFGGILFRLVVLAITFPRKMRAQKEIVDKALEEMKRRYPETFKEIEEEEERERNAEIGISKENSEKSDDVIEKDKSL